MLPCCVRGRDRHPGLRPPGGSAARTLARPGAAAAVAALKTAPSNQTCLPMNLAPANQASSNSTLVRSKSCRTSWCRPCGQGRSPQPPRRGVPDQSRSPRGPDPPGSEAFLDGRRGSVGRFSRWRQQPVRARSHRLTSPAPVAHQNRRACAQTCQHGLASNGMTTAEPAQFRDAVAAMNATTVRPEIELGRSARRSGWRRSATRWALRSGILRRPSSRSAPRATRSAG